MVNLDQRLIFFLIAGVTAYIIFKLFLSSKDSAVSATEQEIEKIISSKEHRVKGRFED
jgi:hypothetical protein